MSYHTVSPSKNMTLNQLLKVKDNNYMGLNGNDYCCFEIESRIIELKTKLANKTKYVPVDFGPVVQAKQDIKFEMISNNKKTMFKIDMANEKAA
jgi:hypothetical protein